MNENPDVQKIAQLTKKIKDLLLAEAVLILSAFAAVLTMFFVPPSKGYIDYIDFRTLSLLFCLMLTISGLKEEGLFNTLARRITTRLKNSRTLCLALTLMCFFSSMFITNDVALITFIPFTIVIYTASGLQKSLIYTIVVETVAANLGSMLTPVGNPQNLYLYSYYHIGPVEFFQIMLPISFVGLLLTVGASLICKKQPALTFANEAAGTLRPGRLAVYALLFLLCLLSVFYVVDYRIMLAIVVLAVAFADRRLLLKADYGLLLTFVCFFIFVGNVERIDTIHKALSAVLDSRELLAGILLSQVISNVPAAVLLSGFTERYSDLLLGVNIGGLGTLVASLASLISFKFYIRTEQAKPLSYLGKFTAVNLALLVPLLLFSVSIS